MLTRPRLDAECKGWSRSSARYHLASAVCALCRWFCKFISGFVYLIYSASIISNRLKSFSCLIMLVLLTICSLFNVLLWNSWLCLSGAPYWRCIVILRERVVRVYPINAWGSQSPTLHSYLYRIFVLCSLFVLGLFFITKFDHQTSRRHQAALLSLLYLTPCTSHFYSTLYLPSSTTQ